MSQPATQTPTATRIKVITTALKHALSRFDKLIPNRAQKPEDTYVYASGTGAALIFQGGTSDLNLRTAIPAEGGTGQFAVPFELFRNLVGSIRSQEISLELGSQLTIVAGSFTSHISLATSALPQPKHRQGQLELPTPALVEGIPMVAHAANRSNTPGPTHGILLELSDKRVRLAATDNYSLAVRDFELPHALTLEQPLQVILPVKAAEQIVSVFQREAGLRVLLADNTLFVTNDSNSLLVKLLAGEFPNFARHLAKTAQFTVSAESDALRQTLGRMTVLGIEHHKVVLDFGPGQVKVQAEGALGNASDSLAAEVKGQGGMASFNAELLARAIGPCDGVLQLEVGTKQPLIVKGKAKGYTALVRPLAA